MCKNRFERCEKKTFRSFLKRFLNEKEVNEGIEYIENKFKEKANDNKDYFLSSISNIFQKELEPTNV